MLHSQSGALWCCCCRNSHAFLLFAEGIPIVYYVGGPLQSSDTFCASMLALTSDAQDACLCNRSRLKMYQEAFVHQAQRISLLSITLPHNHYSEITCLQFPQGALLTCMHAQGAEVGMRGMRDALWPLKLPGFQNGELYRFIRTLTRYMAVHLTRLCLLLTY
jgi:hypothetical protein